MTENRSSVEYLENMAVNGSPNEIWAEPTEFEPNNFKNNIEKILVDGYTKLKNPKKLDKGDTDLELALKLGEFVSREEDLKFRELYKRDGDEIILKENPIISNKDMKYILKSVKECKIIKDKDRKVVYVPDNITKKYGVQGYTIYEKNNVGDYEVMKQKNLEVQENEYSKPIKNLFPKNNKCGEELDFAVSAGALKRIFNKDS